MNNKLTAVTPSSKLEAEGSSETSVPIHQIVLCHVLENSSVTQRLIRMETAA
jgi:hypothetical protein